LATSGDLNLAIDNPDAPGGTYVHWIVFGLPPTLTHLAAGEVPDGALQAKNSGRFSGYQPPCPRASTHTYRFAVYALGQRLNLPDGCGAREALDAIRNAAIAGAILYSRFGLGVVAP